MGRLLVLLLGGTAAGVVGSIEGGIAGSVAADVAGGVAVDIVGSVDIGGVGNIQAGIVKSVQAVLKFVTDVMHYLADWIDRVVGFFAGLPFGVVEYQLTAVEQVLLVWCTFYLYFALRERERE